VAKYGRNWRLRVLNNECVEALKVFNYVHGVISPNDRTDRRGRPSASALATDVARPRSVQ
jgi:hypothetical protein